MCVLEGACGGGGSMYLSVRACVERYTYGEGDERPSIDAKSVDNN